MQSLCRKEYYGIFRSGLLFAWLNFYFPLLQTIFKKLLDIAILKNKGCLLLASYCVVVQVLYIPGGRGGGGGSTPLYGLYRYVRPQRV